MLVFPIPGRLTNTSVCAWRDAVFTLKITTRAIGYHKTIQVVRGEVGRWITRVFCYEAGVQQRNTISSRVNYLVWKFTIGTLQILCTTNKRDYLGRWSIMTWKQTFVSRLTEIVWQLVNCTGLSGGHSPLLWGVIAICLSNCTCIYIYKILSQQVKRHYII